MTTINLKQTAVAVALICSLTITGCSQINKEEAAKSKQAEESARQEQQKETVLVVAQKPQVHTQRSEMPIELTDSVQEFFVHAPTATQLKRRIQPERLKGQRAPQLQMQWELQNTENYQAAQVSNVYTTAQNPLSTFSIDVDTASYTNVRRLLSDGIIPNKHAVRVEEMLNYFNYQYPTPTNSEHPFAIHTEIAPSPWDRNTHLMKIGLKGYEVEQQTLAPMNLVFLIDVSGSMRDVNKLPLLKRAFRLLTKKLRPQDSVAIVTYAGSSGLVLEPTKGDNQQKILDALDNLTSGGGTNGAAGIHQAYRVAQQHFITDGINRVLLASDGDFNVGTSDIEQLKTLVEEKKQTGVFLSVLGFGAGNYNDHLAEEISNIGNGTAYYIDSFNEARKVFSTGLTSTLHTIAKDVKIQVEFNPQHVSEYRLIGYDNRALNNEDFNNDKVDAGDIGAGHTVTAFYEITLSENGQQFIDELRYQDNNAKKAVANTDEVAFIKLRYKQPTQENSQLITQAIERSDIKSNFEQSSSDFKFATAVVGFGENLRHSQHFNWSLEQINQLASANIGKDAWGYRHEFVQLIRNAESLKQ